jgi:hypothetical protein
MPLGSGSIAYSRSRAKYLQVSIKKLAGLDLTGDISAVGYQHAHTEVWDEVPL